MKTQKVVDELKKLYPNKSIVLNPLENPTEIVCEIEPTKEHPEYSIAIAVIDSSKMHYHKVTTETYEVIKGLLKLIVDNKAHELKVGDTFTINPGLKHCAQGAETWVKVTSKPGWIIVDHLSV